MVYSARLFNILAPILVLLASALGHAQVERDPPPEDLSPQAKVLWRGYFSDPPIYSADTVFLAPKTSAISERELKKIVEELYAHPEFKARLDIGTEFGKKRQELIKARLNQSLVHSPNQVRLEYRSLLQNNAIEKPASPDKIERAAREDFHKRTGTNKVEVHPAFKKLYQKIYNRFENSLTDPRTGSSDKVLFQALLEDLNKKRNETIDSAMLLLYEAISEKGLSPAPDILVGFSVGFRTEGEYQLNLIETVNSPEKAKHLLKKLRQKNTEIFSIEIGTPQEEMIVAIPERGSILAGLRYDSGPNVSILRAIDRLDGTEIREQVDFIQQRLLAFQKLRGEILDAIKNNYTAAKLNNILDYQTGDRSLKAIADSYKGLYGWGESRKRGFWNDRIRTSAHLPNIGTGLENADALDRRPAPLKKGFFSRVLDRVSQIESRSRRNRSTTIDSTIAPGLITKGAPASNTPKQNAADHPDLFEVQNLDSHSAPRYFYVSNDIENRKEFNLPNKAPRSSLRVTSSTALPHSTNGFLIIPRPHGHAISKLSVLGHEGKTLAYRKDYIVHETGDGLSYLIEFRKKQPNGVRPSVEFVRQPTGPGINSELSSLDLDALAKINARLNKVGFTQIANALDQRIAFARKQGASLSMSDLESIVAHAGLYSYIKESQIDPRAIELDSTFGPHAKFLHQGVLCAQCDGANAFFADIMQEYFKAAGSKLEVFDASSLVNQAGILNDGIRHAQIGIRDPNSSDRIASFLIYDATAKRKDPRNPKSVETPQGDLDSQPIARTRSRVKDTIKELEANDTNLKATFSKYKHRVMKSASDPIVRTTRLNMITSDLLGGKITLPDATALLNETLGLTGDDAFASFQSIDEMLSTIQQQARKTLTLIDRLDESKSLRTIQLPVRDAARTTLRTIDAELESINSTDVFDHWTGLDRIPDVDGAACSLLLIMQRAKSN